MSIDSVDDMHAAEDHIGYLQTRAERVVSLWDDYTNVSMAEFSDAVRALALATSTRFVRPSCEAHLCGDDCGGYHPPSWRENCTADCPEHREEDDAA